MAPYRSFRSMAMVFLPICALLTITYLAFVSFDSSGFQNDKAQIMKLKNTMEDKQQQPLVTTPNNTTSTVKAAFVVLVRNSELDDLRSAMRQMEDRFNHRYNYPWVFLNDADFSDEFMAKTKGIASGNTFYGKVDDTMWGYPEWIDQDKAGETRENMKEVIYGDSESYRHMCRFQSGFFFRHPLMLEYDYYWRVEPGVEFSCSVDYDPFALMQEKNMKYGWTISLKEYEETIPTLWKTAKEFMQKYPQHVVPKDDPGSLLKWVSDDDGETYNLCHFWSNFEIGSIKWLNSPAYLDFFNYLDQNGGFFYERWGDAPVHSIAAALLLKKDEVHWFYDHGYFHNPFHQCPREPAWVADEKCLCNPEDSFDEHWYSCTPKWLELTGKKRTDYLVTTRS
ncbi:hypothetical protein INT44_001854 [Umbelopsis vinacea]|uniref:Uncharacterized protein n=1 Tax=Umbelopsis vinacea TaxID=44442 RepID=A0A8H7UAT4_9FUNG|nr:hypothetical protein INT44_001854 [Umbelopsis vinacea]